MEEERQPVNETAPALHAAPQPAAGDSAWGQALRLRLRPTPQIITLAPAWAVLAGALAAGIAWNGANLLRLLTVIVLVEGLYEAFFGPAEPPTGATPPQRLQWLPYSRPDSPSGRLARWWGRVAAGRAGDMAVTILVAGILAIWIGLPAVWATLAFLGLGGLRLGLGRLWAGLGRWVEAAAGALLPWLLAGALFGGVGGASLLGALAYAAARGALLDGGRLARSRWAFILADACQLGVLATLIVLKRPLAAAILAAPLAAQLFVQASSRRSADAAGLARVQLLITAGMLLFAGVIGQ
jgi:hypothetical protein